MTFEFDQYVLQVYKYEHGHFVELELYSLLEKDYVPKIILCQCKVEIKLKVAIP